MDEYAFVSKSALKLKRDDGIKKKKKKKNIDAEKVVETIRESSAKTNQETIDADQLEPVRPKLTKAERSFQKKQEKRQMERILVKASKSHKQRVEDFNSHLDSLSEHYDIPKVSWTK
ncbi:Protein FAM32A [Halotydeus destructor]|nr:Protein FAM32A [Halotydeus destructor]